MDSSPAFFTLGYIKTKPAMGAAVLSRRGAIAALVEAAVNSPAVTAAMGAAARDGW
jgi:hypothetical protein